MGMGAPALIWGAVGILLIIVLGIVVIRLLRK